MPLTVNHQEELIFSSSHHSNNDNGQHVPFLEQSVLSWGVFDHMYAMGAVTNEPPLSHENTKVH